MKKFILAGLAVLLLCLIILGSWLASVLSRLPDVSTLKQYRPAAAAEVLDKDGALVCEYFDRKYRIWVPISSIPPVVIQAVTTAEDDTFFEHKGVNYQAVWDALVHDFHKRRFARGGSTITQQMIKNVFLTKEKTITRKVKEYVLARRAEEVLTKRQILQIYLNEVEWGDNIYGIEAASRSYLGKHAADLSAGEAALLAGMLPNPRYYNPFKRPEKAQDRQHRVLTNMVQAKLISQDEYEAAIRAGVPHQPPESAVLAAAGREKTRRCYEQALEQVLIGIYGEQKVYRGGLQIRTTLDKGMQADLSALDDAPQGSGAGLDEVTTVSQDGKVRAILCSAKEEGIREKLSTPVIGAVGAVGYTVSRVSLDSIGREQILLHPEEASGKPARARRKDQS